MQDDLKEADIIMRLELGEFTERRATPRNEASITVDVRSTDWRPYKGLISNVSLSGISLSSAGKYKVGDVVSLALPGVGVRRARVTRAGLLRRYGCEFEKPLAPHQLTELLAGARSTWVHIGKSLAEAA